ncbi:hypothetical protein D7Y13_28345 [Corallococcus praedator]|uniref:DUF5872 domain-containing protein n=1 Tax=Corallococcus praedator TaxID=2316724 RepID=A0ABX9QBT7_9BACT|nr:hypothetical protein [Corallococcus praedator]RKH99040.1 hypothetical protein D7Y13_28345 [Corallococcus praedator]
MPPVERGPRPRRQHTAAAPAKRTARKASASASGRYSDPALRERLKKRIMKSDKGGRPGQWSARKAQLLASEYKKAGGGYSGSRAKAQRHLSSWTKEAWQTQDGGTRARHGRTTARYLPKDAWAHLSPAQKKATERRKRTGSRAGRQFVANTPAARRARKQATKR